MRCAPCRAAETFCLAGDARSTEQYDSMTFLPKQKLSSAVMRFGPVVP